MNHPFFRFGGRLGWGFEPHTKFSKSKSSVGFQLLEWFGEKEEVAFCLGGGEEGGGGVAVFV